MAIQHAVITDPDIHEPKGISTAAAHTHYKADGLGSGAWEHHAGSVHGEIYLADATVSVGPTGGTITTDADYRVIGGTWTLNDAAYNVALHTDSHSVQVAVTGHYMISAFASFNTGAVAVDTDYSMKFRINDTTYSSRKLVTGKSTATVDRLTLTGTGLVFLTALDYVNLVLGSSVADTITVKDAGIVLILLHE